METRGLILLTSGCLSALLTVSCAGVGAHKTPEAPTPAKARAPYTPPELQTKDWNNYLFGNTAPLIKEKKYDQALTRLDWFWNHILEHEPAMYGVRLSFCLGVWKDLADVYPPALAELKQLRDGAEKKALQGDTQAFAEAVNLNRTLKESTRTVELFKKLDKTQPELAKKMWHFADMTLIEHNEYALSLKYGPTLEKRWSTIQERMKKELTLDYAKTILSLSGGASSPEKLKAFQKNMVRYYRNMEVAPLVRLCGATGKKKLAAEIETQFNAMVKPIVGNSAK